MINFKLNFLASLFLLFSINLLAQEAGAKLNWSERIKATDLRTLGVSDEYLVIQDGFDMPSILVLDKTHFKEVNTIDKFKPQIDGKNAIFLNGIVFQNKLIITLIRKDKNYIQRYSIPQLELENTIEIGEVEPYLEFSDANGQFFSASIKTPKPNIQFIMSENKENLWILYDNSGPEKKHKVEYMYQSFTKTFTGNRSSVSINIEPEYYSRLNLCISNGGRPYIFYKKSMETKQSYYILDVFKKESYPLNMEMSMVNQKMFQYKSKIQLSGICYHEKAFKLFTVNFDIEKARFEKIVFTPIELGKTLEYADKSTIKKANKDIYNQPILNYSVDGAKYLEDGSKYIYGEYYTNVIIMKSTEYVEHTSNEIFVAYIDKSGKLLSFNIIPKWQNYTNAIGENTACGSYLCYLKDDKLNFIFEDNAKNNTVDLHQKHSVIKDYGNQTTICTVSKNGKVQRNIWLNNKELDIYPCPFLSYETSEGEYIIGSYLKGNFKFATLKY
jgi:hypothetical protein